MSKNVILITVLLIFTANTSFACAHTNKFCQDVLVGAKLGQQNHNYIFARKLWNKLNIHSAEENDPTVSFGNKTTMFYNMCTNYSGESRTIIVIKIYNFSERLRKSTDDMG
jgi:hypothetical protein